MGKNKKFVEDFEKSSKSYFNDISKYSPLPKDEEMKLWEEYKKTNSTSARDKIIKSNLKFVASVASKYIGMGLSYPDLIAEGNIGLLKAIDKFEYEKGYKTISYAVWWIRQTILEAIEKRNLINGDDSILNTNISDDSDYEMQYDDQYQEEINDEYIDDDMKSIESFDESFNILSLLNCLNEREKSIISKYYGLDGEKPVTLEEIGESLGLTKERIRQIKELAIKKLRCEALRNSITSENYN